MFPVGNIFLIGTSGPPIPVAMTHPPSPDRPENTDGERSPDTTPDGGECAPADGGRGVLRRGGPGGGEPPDGADAPFVLDHLAVLTHEMNNLLDGSLRTLELARRALDRSAADESGGTLGEALRRVETVQRSLERMADLVAASMRPAVSSIGSWLLGPSAPITLGEAIRHASEVLRPLAEERGVSVELCVDDRAAGLAAGPIYPVVLNALHNAMDSIERATLMENRAGRARAGGGRGAVRVSARVDSDERGPRVVIEVCDDGEGLASMTPSSRFFEHGFTTKSGGAGIGLALSRSVVRGLGGVIELAPRPERLGEARPGAVLRVSYAPPSDRHAPLGRAES